MGDELDAKPQETPPDRKVRRMRPPAGLAAALAEGMPDNAIAARFGCDRGAVARWSKRPEVVAERERIEQRMSEETIDKARKRLRALIDPALGVVETILRGTVSVTCPCGCGHTFEVLVPAVATTQRARPYVATSRRGWGGEDE